MSFKDNEYDEYLEHRRITEGLYPHFNFWEITFLVRTGKSYTEAWAYSPLCKKDRIEEFINEDVKRGIREGWLQHFDAIKLEIVGNSLIMKPVTIEKDNPMSEITLANLGGGAAVEKFQEEFEKVVKNVLDPNTDPKAKREVVLKVIIQPNAERNWTAMKIEASAKLAPNVAYATRAFIGVDHKSGRVVACEDNPNQMTINDFMEDNENVENIEEHREEIAEEG